MYFGYFNIVEFFIVIHVFSFLVLSLGSLNRRIKDDGYQPFKEGFDTKYDNVHLPDDITLLVARRVPDRTTAD